jgi:hypothetical protein
MKVAFVPVDAEAVGAVASAMRAEDVRCCAIEGLSPREGLERSVRDSDFCMALKLDGEYAMVFGGVLPRLGGSGMAWALGTEACRRHPRLMVEGGRRAAGIFLSIWPSWANAVPSTDRQALKWLAMIGFHIDPVPFKDRGFEFWKITLEG